MKNIFFIMLFALFTILLDGCKKEQTTAPTSTITGNLIGSVTLRNEAGYYAGTYSSITVAVDGTNLSTQTDSGGNYSIKGIEKGDRVIVFSKGGYGTYKEYRTIVGDSTLQLNQIALYVLPPFNVINMSAKIVNDKFIVSARITNTSNNNRGIVVFTYSDSTVSPDPGKYRYASKFYILPNVDSFSQPDYISNLFEKGFKSGQKVYLVAYGTMPYLPYDSYFDVNYNKAVFCSLSKTPSNKISFTIL